MTSQHVSGSFSTVASAVNEAVISYRRAQYFPTQNIPNLDTEYDSDDEEANIGGSAFDAVDEFDSDASDNVADDLQQQRRRRPTDEHPHDLHWEHDSSSVEPETVTESQQITQYFRSPPLNIGPAKETSPLLQNQKKRKYDQVISSHHPRQNKLLLAPPQEIAVRRKSSVKSIRPAIVLGQSTYGQTFFNSCAILLGIGMLSEPIAFAHAGWVASILMNVAFGAVTCYTAKILARIILEDSSLHSYSDIGHKAFGAKGTVLVTLFFCVELFAVSVILVTLCADSLHTLLPQWPSNSYKLLSLAILIPTVFLPLHLLSYASIIGIFSTIMIIVVIMIDGFSKTTSPGSLITPAETHLGVGNWREVGIAAGLLMAGFSGHTVIPSLAKDMQQPHLFNHMINRAFAVATLIYTVIGMAGYLMFGAKVSEEVSTDLLRIPEYNQVLNKLCLWMLVLSPLSKFALATRPVNRVLELILNVTPRPDTPHEEGTHKSEHSSIMDRHLRLRQGVLIGERAIFATLSVVVSILVPDFSIMMGFLGAFCAFVLCVIGPIAAKAVINKELEVLDMFLIVFAALFAVWGTVAAFSSA